jgi:hypothetical protein
MATKLDSGHYGTEAGVVTAGTDLAELYGVSPIPRSASVVAVTDRLTKLGDVSAWDIVNGILEEYLIALAANPSLDPPDKTRVLLESEEVKEVLRGKGVGASLTLQAVDAFASLSGTQATVASSRN